MPDKPRERWHLRQLRTALGSSFPYGQVADDERPDFVIHAKSGAVGIEMTTLHLPPSPGERPAQERQSLKNDIVIRAANLHRVAGGPALYVRVTFNPRFPLTKGKKRPLAEAIANCVTQALVPPSFGTPQTVVPSDHLPQGIMRISMNASVSSTDRMWAPDWGNWETPVEPHHIESVIQGKLDMVAEARTKCGELWLVIVLDDFSFAAPAELTSAAKNSSYKHPFDRLLWLEANAPRVCSLTSK